MSKVKYLLDNDPSDLELTFTEEVFDQSDAPVGEVELKPGGRDIAVTELNRHEYLHLLACVPPPHPLRLRLLSSPLRSLPIFNSGPCSEYRLSKSAEARIGAFKEGFHALITEVSMFLFEELNSSGA